jgi:GTPase SAR1 family protein
MGTLTRWVPQMRMACPYCYDSFYRWQILFQCSGKPSRLGRQCTPAQDDAYAARFGDIAQLPVFESWRQRKAVHAPCGELTWFRVCPHCHHRLPADFERVPSRMVAIVGARDSGKTAMITVLIKELDGRVGDRLGLTVWPADEETRREYAAYKEVIYTDNSVPFGTRPLGTQGTTRAPMVFAIAARRRGRRRAKRTLLSFFDTAGEDLRTKESVERNAQYLRSADAILLLLDPLQTEGGREGVLGTGATNTSPDEPFSVLQRITELIQAGRYVLRVHKPLAIALSKVDLFRSRLSPLSPLGRPEPELEGFATKDGAAVQSEVQRLLRELDGNKIQNFVAANYTRYHYFGFSALGHTPADKELMGAGVMPYRVVDPFVWLLTQLGAARAVKDG